MFRCRKGDARATAAEQHRTVVPSRPEILVRTSTLAGRPFLEVFTIFLRAAKRTQVRCCVVDAWGALVSSGAAHLRPAAQIRCS
jgi:hypothetical protein